MITSVYITVDVECAEERMVRGKIQPPIGYDIMMWGRFANQRRPLGVQLIMDILEQRHQRASFFVETLCAEVFGREGLREVCVELAARGHDVQLQLHPNMRRPSWRERGARPLPDNIGDYSTAEQVQMLRDGIDHLVACGVARDQVTAFRAGNFGGANSTWDALAEVGISLDCSYNPTFLHSDCGFDWPNTCIDLFAPRDDVWELPVGSFRAAFGLRHLQITAVSAAEMRAGLLRARENGVQCVSIVTHPAEFFMIDSVEKRRGRPNRINIARLQDLSDFLARHPDKFAVKTAGTLAGHLRAGAVRASPSVPAIPHGSVMNEAARVVVQGLKRLETNFGFA